MDEDVQDTEEILEDEELMNEEPPVEEPPVLEPNEAELNIEPPKNGSFLGVASKALIRKLLKTKLIAIAAVGLGIFLFIAIFIVISNSSKVNDYVYVKDQCKTVTVNYEPYTSEEGSSKTMDIEEYVKDATYTYTKNFKKKSMITFHVYKSLAIALRSEAVTNNCNVTYHEELEKKPSEGEEIEILDSALEAAHGVIVTKMGSKKPLPVRVSKFCYSENDGTNYSIYQVPDFTIPTKWVQENITESVYKNCPCNQPDENKSSCWAGTNWLHQDDTSGYNVYAALYLAEEYGLNSDTILNYFIGDHMLRTIHDQEEEEDEDNKTNDASCGIMDLHTTSLSKSEFVNGLKNYTGNSSPQMDLFKKNAEKIYDVGVANNLNPEFIVARAVSEGFSPAADKHPNSNNFWGWNCTNTGGGTDCRYFDSDFEKALVEYCNLVTKQFKDMDDLLMRYAQLGTYWYNPGNWSLGGCAYKDYIFPDGIPSRVQDACQSGKSCDSGGNGYCVKVTPDEQKMYGKWQLRKMLATRKAIWGLEEGDCSQKENGAGCFWWPVGSNSTTQKGGITYATGDPAATTITSGYGKRTAPTATASTTHNAIDIGGGTEGQTNIIAVADGTVTQVSTGCVKGNSACGGRLGNAVYIKHNDGSETRYGHMYSVSVSKGDQVKQGQVIGKMGTTGDSTGTHLDFQVKVNGTIVNPLNYVSSSNPRPKCNGDGSVITGSSEQQTVCLTLKNNGYSNNAVAAIMGNMKAESGIRTVNTNHQGCDGLVQWCGSRLTKLKSTYGNKWKNVDSQLKFVLYELNNSYKSVDKYLKEKHSEREMAYKFCMEYEQPGEYYCKNNGYEDYAEELLPYVKNGCK